MLRGALNSGPVAGKLWRPQEEVVSKASGGTLWEENRAPVVTEQEKGKPSRRNYIREPPSSLAHSQRTVALVTCSLLLRRANQGPAPRTMKPVHSL